VSARVLDAHGNPVAGATVSFAFGATQSGLGLETPLGPALSAGTVPTNAAGYAVVTYTAGYLVGTDEVVASVNLIDGTVAITVQPATCSIAPVNPPCASAPPPIPPYAQAPVAPPDEVDGIAGL
jgi:hypothetical protein